MHAQVVQEAQEKPGMYKFHGAEQNIVMKATYIAESGEQELAMEKLDKKVRVSSLLACPLTLDGAWSLWSICTAPMKVTVQDHIFPAKGLNRLPPLIPRDFSHLSPALQGERAPSHPGGVSPVPRRAGAQNGELDELDVHTGSVIKVTLPAASIEDGHHVRHNLRKAFGLLTPGVDTFYYKLVISGTLERRHAGGSEFEASNAL